MWSRGGLLAAGVATAILCDATADAQRAGAAQPGAAAWLRSAGRPDLGQLWSEAAALERRGREVERDHPRDAVERYVRAARGFERIARERPGLAQAYWRGARAFWLAGDALPLDAKGERVRYFEHADALSSVGIEVDPDCAECMLWKFSAMGRLRTTRGIWTSLRQLPEMVRLLDRAIALDPNYVEDEENSTLGNLHYSSAIFYRVFPDWIWIGWLLGVRGDKERALGHVRTALSLHPSRLDYQIELGAQLLCLGSSRSDRERLAEGAKVMQAALLRDPETQDDVRELAAALIMVEQPGKACGYTGDAWIEIDRREARSVAERARVAP